MRTIIVAALIVAVSIVVFNLSNAQDMKNYPFTAKGTFTVAMKPEAQTKVGTISFGKYSIDKVFKGALEGTSRVDMLSAGSDNGEGAYVAIENITGTLNGKTGTFVLMHNGTRTRTSQELTVTIVPGCSTGELAGIEGRLTITIEGKEHFYVLEYSLGDR